MVDFMGGLLGGWDSFMNPTPPPGAGYDAETARMARAALLSKIGGSLISASQGGQSFDQRAAALRGVSDAPGAAAEVIQGGVKNAYLKTQADAQKQEMALKAREAERIAAEDAYFRQGLGPAVGATQTPPPQPLGTSTAGALANVPVVGGSVAPPVGGELQKGPVQEPQAPAAQPGAGTWWGDLGLTLGEAQSIARMPAEQRRSVVADLVKKKADRREKYDIVGDAKSGYTKVYADGRKEPLTQGSEGIPGGVDGDVMAQEKQLRQEFHDRTKDFASRQTAYKTVQDLAAKGEGASDVALIISVMKVYDPSSTVTGNEVATMANAGGVPGQLQAMYNQVVGGGKLGADARQQLVDAAGSRYAQEYDAYGQQVQSYQQLAQQYQVDPGRTVRDERDQSYGRIRELRAIPVERFAQATPQDVQVLLQNQQNLTPAQRAALQARVAALRNGGVGGGR